MEIDIEDIKCMLRVKKDHNPIGAEDADYISGWIHALEWVINEEIFDD
jgi:hypothetical protein